VDLIDNELCYVVFTKLLVIVTYSSKKRSNSNLLPLGILCFRNINKWAKQLKVW